MKTLDEIFDIIESLNDEAHSDAWDSWVAADEMAENDDDESYEMAENMREEASDEQAEYFRDAYYSLEEEDQEAIKHWLKEDESFKEQLQDWFGHEEFDEEFGEES